MIPAAGMGAKGFQIPSTPPPVPRAAAHRSRTSAHTRYSAHTQRTALPTFSAQMFAPSRVVSSRCDAYSVDLLKSTHDQGEEEKEQSPVHSGATAMDLELAREEAAIAEEEAATARKKAAVQAKKAAAAQQQTADQQAIHAEWAAVLAKAAAAGMNLGPLPEPSLAPAAAATFSTPRTPGLLRRAPSSASSSSTGRSSSNHIPAFTSPPRSLSARSASLSSSSLPSLGGLGLRSGGPALLSFVGAVPASLTGLSAQTTVSNDGATASETDGTMTPEQRSSWKVVRVHIKKMFELHRRATDRPTAAIPKVPWLTMQEAQANYPNARNGWTSTSYWDFANVFEKAPNTVSAAEHIALACQSTTECPLRFLSCCFSCARIVWPWRSWIWLTKISAPHLQNTSAS